MVENQKGRKIKYFRSDNGGEFVSYEFEKYMKSIEIIHQTTNSYIQNGMESEYESCVFLKCHSDVVTVIALYADDCFIFSNNKNEKWKVV